MLLRGTRRTRRTKVRSESPTVLSKRNNQFRYLIRLQGKEEECSFGVTFAIIKFAVNPASEETENESRRAKKERRVRAREMGQGPPAACGW